MLYNLNGKYLNVSNLIIPDRRTISIRIVYPDSLEVISPYPLKEDDIIAIIDRHRRFINKRFVNSEMDLNHIHLLGKKYDILIFEADFDNILVDEYQNKVKVYTKNTNDEYVRNVVDSYYRLVLINILDKNIDQIKFRMKLNKNIVFKYKKVDTYYGECFPKRNEVILNIKLAKYELKYILSVIYHELAHFYYMNHQKGFYDLLESVFPNYKKVQSDLRKIKYNEKY